MFIRNLKRGSNTYRYEVMSYWDKIKRAPRQRVKYLGKVIFDERNRETVKKKYFLVETVEKSMIVGDLAAYFKVATELGLVDIINRCCPKNGDEPGIPILILVFNQLIGRIPLHKLSEWVDNTPLSTWFGIELHLTKDIFLSALDSLCRAENGEILHYGWAVQKEVVKRWRALYHQDHKRLYYDVSKLIYYGTHCALAEKGRKYDDGKREIGVALVTSQGCGFPVLCRPIHGAKSDTITAREIVGNLTNWEIRKATIIMDRVMANAPNLKYIRAKGYHVLVGCSETSIDVLMEIGRWSDESLMLPQNIYTRGKKQYLYLKGWEGTLFGYHGKFVVILDPMRQAEERMNRDWIQKELHLTISKKQRKKLEDYLKVKYHDYGDGQPEHSMAVMHREDAIRRRAGRFLLFSTNKRCLDEEMFRWYFQKDEIEKAFRTLNNNLSLLPVKYQNPNRIEAYLTVNFLAYLIWSVIRYELRKKGEKMSVYEVIEEAKKIVQIRFLSRGKKINTLLQLTLAQWELINILGIKHLLPET
jgi:hypothetical protein